MSLPSKHSWKFYLLVAHLVDEHGHTACNRQLPFFDEPDKNWNGKSHKCKTCSVFGVHLIVKEGSVQK
jgi:hypothetical protein